MRYRKPSVFKVRTCNVPLGSPAVYQQYGQGVLARPKLLYGVCLSLRLEILNLSRAEIQIPSINKQAHATEPTYSSPLWLPTTVVCSKIVAGQALRKQPVASKALIHEYLFVCLPQVLYVLKSSHKVQTQRRERKCRVTNTVLFYIALYCFSSKVYKTRRTGSRACFKIIGSLGPLFPPLQACRLCQEAIAAPL